MRTIHIVNQSRPLRATLRVVFCSSYLCRLRGLTFRRRLPEEEGLLLVFGRQSRLDTAIHMLFVFFSLGIVWLNDAHRVVDARLARPWVSFLASRQPARFVLEIHPDRLQEFSIGDEVRFEEMAVG